MKEEEIYKKLEELSAEIKKYSYADNEEVHTDEKFITRCKLTRRIVDCIHAIKLERYDIDLNQELSLKPLI